MEEFIKRGCRKLRERVNPGLSLPVKKLRRLKNKKRLEYDCDRKLNFKKG